MSAVTAVLKKAVPAVRQSWLSQLSDKAVTTIMKKLSQLTGKAVTAIMKKLSQLSGKAMTAIIKSYDSYHEKSCPSCQEKLFALGRSQ